MRLAGVTFETDISIGDDTMMADNDGRRASDRPLKRPRAGGSVWPMQRCPAFTPRSGAFKEDASCWYCKYADFHLKTPMALDVGICCWPTEQID